MLRWVWECRRKVLLCLVGHWHNSPAVPSAAPKAMRIPEKGVGAVKRAAQCLACQHSHSDHCSSPRERGCHGQCSVSSLNSALAAWEGLKASLARPFWAAGPIPGAQPTSVTPGSTLVWLRRWRAPRKECLAWALASVCQERPQVGQGCLQLVAIVLHEVSVPAPLDGPLEPPLSGQIWVLLLWGCLSKPRAQPLP